MPTLPLPPLADVMTLMTVGGLFLAGLAVAAVTAYAFLRARSASSDPVAPAAAPADAIHEMRALGDRIESLVAQQQLQGETQRQRLAQQLDGVQQTVGEQQSAVSGLRNELRHEIGRRDAEMQEIRQQLASIGTSAALPPPAPLALPEPASASSDETPEPAFAPSPAPAAPPFEEAGFEEVSWDSVSFEELSSGSPAPAEPSAPAPTEMPAFGGFEPMELEGDPGSAPDSDPEPSADADRQPERFEPMGWEHESAPDPAPDAQADAESDLFDPMAPAPMAPAPMAPAPMAPHDAPTAHHEAADESESLFAPLDLAELAPFEASASGWDAADAGSDVFAPISIDPEPAVPTPDAAEAGAPPPTPHDAASDATWPTSGPGDPAQEPETELATPEAPMEDAFAFEPAAFDPAELDVAEFEFADAEFDADWTSGVSGDSFDQPPAFPSWDPTAPEAVAGADGSAFDPFALDDDETLTPQPASMAQLAPQATPPLTSDAAWVARPAAAPDTSHLDIPVFGTDEPSPPAPDPAAVEPAGPSDDLTVLSNVDEAVQGRLHLAGVRTLEEIAQWGRNDARRIATEVMVSEDTIMQQWVFEAQAALFRRFTHGR